MLLSIKDMELLRVLCWCKNMSADASDIFQNAYTQEDVLTLKHLDLVSVSRDKSILRPRPAAYKLLSDAGFDFTPDTKIQTNPKLLARRNIAAQILQTFKTAGISVFNYSLPRRIEKPLYVASFAARQQDKGNPFGSTRFHGIFCTTQEAFLVYYVDSFGVFYQNELALFHNFIQATGISRCAIIMMGKSTLEIAAAVLSEKDDKAKEKSRFKQDSFKRVFETTTLPVHFIPLGDAGAQMLKIMLNPDYRTATAKAVLGKRYIPIYAGMTDSDAIHPMAPKNSGVVAVDMDVNRIDRALASARRAGFEKIALYALQEQIPFLKNRYANEGVAEIFGINIDHIKSTIGFDIELEKHPPAAYVTSEGRCFDVADIANYRKAGRQN
ncbi:MAG: hypothetical protein LBU77_04185 [Clostridiales bacterium]|jgi:hypothetical protein|nr:hypothetical protein [Clostridiales bacterium]